LPAQAALVLLGRTEPARVVFAHAPLGVKQASKHRLFMVLIKNRF